jgi:hypothetical protein
MKKKIIFAVLFGTIAILSFSSFIIIQTTEQMANALKEALIQGITNGADLAAKRDGYLANNRIKIPLPNDVKNAESRLRQMGLSKEVDRFLVSLNRSAESAALKSKPIFTNAIRSLTITDALNILKGNQDAATQFLKRTTYEQLVGNFRPDIKQSLDKVYATRYYGNIATKYNRLPLSQNKINTDLPDYTTRKAVDGLFVLIADEEKKIRDNPKQQANNLINTVFGAIFGGG